MDEEFERLEIIRPLLSYEAIPNNILNEHANKSGYSPRTLQRWIKAYREHGEIGLRIKPVKKKRSYKYWEGYIHQQYLSPQRPSVALIHGKCKQKAKQENIKAPSYPTVRRMINSIPQSVRSFHRNKKEFRDKFQVIGELFQATYPGELYLIDHREMDVLIVMPGKEKNQAKRPWITIVLDQYSRALVGYYLDFSPPSSQRVALSLRHAILPKSESDWPVFGIPAKVRHDHGKDLISEHIRQVKLDLHISDIPKEKGNPKGNSELERFNGTMANWEKALPGWVGNSVKARPENISPSLSLTKLEQHFLAFIQDYHYRKHSTTKMTPIDRWNSGIIPRLPESVAELDLLLMPVARSYKIRRDGIHFQTNRYWSDDFLQFIGEMVSLRYNPANLDEIIVLFDNKRITAVRIQGERQNFNEYRQRRAKQVKLMKAFIASESEKKNPPEKEKTKEQSQVLLESYHNRDLQPEKKNELILFAVKEGEDWC